jgi:hypothetical protein
MAFLVAGVLLVGAAGPAHAERFGNMKYLGGLPQAWHRTSGALVLESGVLRFEDKNGRVVFALPLATAQAEIGAEKRTTAGSILRSTALVMVAIPLSAGMVDPLAACSRDTTPILVVRLGEAAGGSTLRWRGPRTQLRDIADAINRAAREAATAPPADAAGPR